MLRHLNTQIVLLLTAFLLTQSTMAKVDLSGLATSAKVQPKEKKIDKVVPQKTKKDSAKIAPEGQDLGALKESLKGVNLVLSSQKNAPNKIDLMLKKAFLHVSIVRAIGRTRSSANQLTEDEKKHLAIAKRILLQLLQPAAKQSDVRKASMHYLLGLISYEYDDYKDQQKNFIEALRLDPKGNQAGSLALMVAEQYFDEEDFDNALKYYNGYLGVMNDKQKDLALYKSAWCYISTEQNEKAETELLKVVQARRTSGFQKDSLRDLAYIAVRHRDELGIIRFGREKITNEEDRNEFYSLSLRYYFQMQSKLPLDNLIKIVLKSEKKIAARLEILGHKITELRADYLNPQLLAYYQSVRTELEKAKVTLEIPELELVKKNLQADMEFVIFQLTEGYQGKASADISMPKNKLAGILEKNILLYDGFFPDSKNKIVIYQVLSDLCVDFKNMACVTQVYGKIKTFKPEDKNWQDVRLKLRANQLILADEIYEKEPDKNEEQMLGIFNEFKKDYPNHELVLRGLKKTIKIHTRRADMPAAEKNYQEIYEREKNPENLYNWAVVLFKQNKFPEALGVIGGQYVGDQKIDQLRIETNLKLADQESQNGDFVKYEAHIQEILRISKDDNKNTLIYVDWLNRSFALPKDGVEHAYSVYERIPASIRERPAFNPFLVRFADSFTSAGKFDHLQKLNFGYMEKSKNPALNYYKIVDYLAYDATSLPRWTLLLRELDPDKKNYLSGMLVLIRPDKALEYFRAGQEKDRAQVSPDMYLIALKMFHKSDQFELTPRDRKMLGSLEKSIKKSEIKVPPVLDEIKKVKFPTSKMSFKTYNTVVETLVPTVKKIRDRTSKAFKDMSIEQQLMVTPEAEMLEGNTARALLEAPLPPGLDDEQKTAYQAGIGDLAKEFSDQAEEYKKLSQGLRDKMNELIKQKNAEALPSIDLEKWAWPKSEVTKKALTLQKESDVQANIYLDSQWALKTIADDDYWATRAGLLARSQNTEVMRAYIKEELTQRKQDALLQKWRSLNPVPENK